MDTGPYLEPEVVAMREGIHERRHAEIQHEEKEANMLAEEILNAPPAWNKIPDLMMKAKDGRMIPGVATKRKREEVDRRNVNIPPGVSQRTCNPVTLQDSIQKIGMSHNRKRMTGRCRINGREYFRWCFVADTVKYILPVQNAYQDPVLQGGKFSAWECVGGPKGLIEKRSIKDRPPATLGEEDYMVNRLDQAAH